MRAWPSAFLSSRVLALLLFRLPTLFLDMLCNSFLLLFNRYRFLSSKKKRRMTILMRFLQEHRRQQLQSCRLETGRQGCKGDPRSKPGSFLHASLRILHTSVLSTYLPFPLVYCKLVACVYAQIRFHPYNFAEYAELLEYSAQYGIVTEAYGSLAYVFSLFDPPFPINLPNSLTITLAVQSRLSPTALSVPFSPRSQSVCPQTRKSKRRPLRSSSSGCRARVR